MNEDVLTEGDLLQQRYRVLGRLATGGMASVWRAQDEVLGRTVAVKVLDCRLLDDAVSRARIRDEAKILARVSHPRIAAVYDYGQVGEAPYLVMELVDGVTLATLISRPEGLPWQLAVRICEQVAEALSAAHECGLVHRDISPGNILWTRSGVKVIDFGLCAVEGAPEETKNLLGTPAYLAPERIEGGVIRPASDVYALGVVLYRAIGGRLPWPAESVIQLLGAHRRLPPAPLDVAGVPPAVIRVCERCLAKDPQERPSAADVARTLSTALEPDAGDVIEAPTREMALGSPVRTVAVLRQRMRVPRPIALGAATIGLIAATGLATTWASHATPREASATQSVALSEPDCHVDYRVTQDDGEQFLATITVRNTSDSAYSGWRLAFGLPGQQQVDPAEASVWSESDGIVTSQSEPEELAPGDDVQLPFAGRYADTNPFPTTFRLDDHVCSTSLLGVSGRPAVPVTVVTQPSGSGSDNGGREQAKAKSPGKGKGGKGKD